jgi:hypothetical protein
MEARTGLVSPECVIKDAVNRIMSREKNPSVTTANKVLILFQDKNETSREKILRIFLWIGVST